MSLLVTVMGGCFGWPIARLSNFKRHRKDQATYFARAESGTNLSGHAFSRVGSHNLVTQRCHGRVRLFFTAELAPQLCWP